MYEVFNIIAITYQKKKKKFFSMKLLDIIIELSLYIYIFNLVHGKTYIDMTIMWSSDMLFKIIDWKGSLSVYGLWSCYLKRCMVSVEIWNHFARNMVGLLEALSCLNAMSWNIRSYGIGGNMYAVQFALSLFFFIDVLLWELLFFGSVFVDRYIIELLGVMWRQMRGGRPLGDMYFWKLECTFYMALWQMWT
jgi:hypothetical protein